MTLIYRNRFGLKSATHRACIGLFIRVAFFSLIRVIVPASVMPLDSSHTKEHRIKPIVSLDLSFVLRTDEVSLVDVSKSNLFSLGIPLSQAASAYCTAI